MSRRELTAGAALLGAVLVGGSALVWAQGGAKSDAQTGSKNEMPSPAAPQAATPPGPRPAQLDRNGALILIRSALLAVNQANETGNYTVLRDLAAPGFRDTNTAARLGDIFANQRGQKLDLSGVAVLDPQLTAMPEIQSNGMLHMAGFFPSAPTQINFELLFTPVDQRWRLYGIAVDVVPSTPSAPQGQAPPPGPQADATPSPKTTSRPAPRAAARKDAPPPEPARP